MFLSAFVALFVLQSNLVVSQVEDPKVCLIDLGCVEGTYMPGYQTEKFEAFLGIPFAEPPIGPLRFKNPIPVRPWNDSLIVKAPKSDCLQKNYLLDDWYLLGREDCLYLNVYRPVKRPDTPLPVMFYIYGGGFFCGTINPDFMDPAYFMDTQEVILVLVNYRLGPLGFLSTGTVEMPGNQGLKDQQLALKWVQKNIAAFGGDPKMVTIFGHSAGASSVHFHMLSESSRNLFHAAILGSGNALGPYVDIIKDPYQQAIQIAEAADIDLAANMTIEELVEILQAVDSNALVTAGDALKSWHRFPLFNFRPTIEHVDWPGAFLTDIPKNLLMNGNVFQVPTLQSLVSYGGEGAVYTLRIWTHHKLRKQFNEDFDERLWQLMELPLEVSVEKRSLIMDMLIAEYFDGKREINNSTISGFTELFSDIGFYYPFWKSNIYSLPYALPNAPVYVVNFNYRGPQSRAFIYNGGAPLDYGVVHMDDIFYLFRSPGLYPVDFEENSKDARLMKEFVALYVDFAKNGVVKDLDECSKDAFNTESDDGICYYLEFLNHVGTGFEKIIHNHFNVKRMRLWDKILEDQL